MADKIIWQMSVGVNVPLDLRALVRQLNKLLDVDRDAYITLTKGSGELYRLVVTVQK